MAQSGVTNFVKYKIPIFKFPSSSVVYLHAQVRICFQDKLNEEGLRCETTCTVGRRKRRNTAGDINELVSYGPVYITNDGLTQGLTHFEISESKSISTVVQAIIIVAITIVLTACIVILVTMVKRRLHVKEV